MSTTLRVALGERSYDILIGDGVLSTLAEFVAARLSARRAVVITDSHVLSICAESAAAALSAGGLPADVLTVPAGEASKCVAGAERLWHELARLKVDRQTPIVAVGGGVVGDLAGFVAATYARGLPLVQVPTTLLAQVDSSVGGKVGINLPAAKNMVGAFWQPTGVLVDVAVLATLPVRELRAGLAEVVKYGAILDAEFFEYLEQHTDAILARQPRVLQHIIARSCRLKADVVEQDEREESGLRALLNYGHTFCHAIETVTGYDRYLHGEAVAIGMICASRLAEQLGRVDSQVTQRQINLLHRFGLETDTPGLDPQALLAVMQRDKKSQHGRLRFVLPSRLGSGDLVNDVDPNIVHRAVVP